MTQIMDKTVTLLSYVEFIQGLFSKSDLELMYCRSWIEE